MISVVSSRLARFFGLLLIGTLTVFSAPAGGPLMTVERDRNAGVNVTFQTVAGLRYQLLSSPDLDQWQPTGEPIDGRNDIVSFSFNSGAAQSREFYRVLVRSIPAPVPLTFESHSAESVKFGFPSTPGLQYQVLASFDLLTWFAWGDLIVANGSRSSFGSDPGTAALLFFRVEPVEIIPAPDMVRIPAGTFLMGSPLTEAGRDLDEDPLTTVTFLRGFWMGKYEVTQAEYLRVMGDNPSKFKGNPNRPVEQVTWKEAMAYCARLTQREQAAGRLPSNYAYRLPTEAEFEYTARAGSNTRFSFGDDHGYTALPEYAWFGDNSGGMSQPVGQKRPNAFGLYDMHGNVWEWCYDWYKNAYSGGSVTHPTGPETGASRVFRGGGWDYGANSCRSAYRNYVSPTRRLGYLGFRIVLSSVQ